MKRNRVRQAADSETDGILQRIRKLITENPNTATAYTLWTAGTIGGIALALRGQSKGERYARTIAHGSLGTLGPHLTATGVSVRDAVSDNLAKNVALKLNTFLNDTINPGQYECSLMVKSLGSGKFDVSVNDFFPQSFSLTPDEMEKIVNTTSYTDIYDAIEGPLKKNGITSTFTNNSLTLKYGSNNICYV